MHLSSGSKLKSFRAGAFIRFGKGRHKAALNFGDCIVFATAKQTELPLLSKDGDFIQADLPLSQDSS